MWGRRAEIVPARLLLRASQAERDKFLCSPRSLCMLLLLLQLLGAAASAFFANVCLPFLLFRFQKVPAPLGAAVGGSSALMRYSPVRGSSNRVGRFYLMWHYRRSSQLHCFIRMDYTALFTSSKSGTKTHKIATPRSQQRLRQVT